MILVIPYTQKIFVKKFVVCFHVCSCLDADILTGPVCKLSSCIIMIWYLCISIKNRLPCIWLARHRCAFSLWRMICLRMSNEKKNGLPCEHWSMQREKKNNNKYFHQDTDRERESDRVKERNGNSFAKIGACFNEHVWVLYFLHMHAVLPDISKKRSKIKSKFMRSWYGIAFKIINNNDSTPNLMVNYSCTQCLPNFSPIKWDVFYCICCCCCFCCCQHHLNWIPARCVILIKDTSELSHSEH